MANARPEGTAATTVPSRPATTAAPRRAEGAAARPEAKPGPVSRANEIVRAIGLRPITGLSGPRIGY